MAKQDSRTTKTDDQARESRGSQDRAVTENREITDRERLDAFRQSFFQSALPDLPKIPGYHVCWLTTTNPRDSIPSRMRLGYSPVTLEDVPGWDYSTLKTGEYVGCIGVNEMVAFKLPNRIYQSFMAEAHHHQPAAEEGKLSSVIDAMRGEAQAKGIRAVEIRAESGTASLGKRTPHEPDFVRQDVEQSQPLIKQTSPDGLFDGDDLVPVEDDEG